MGRRLGETTLECNQARRVPILCIFLLKYRVCFGSRKPVGAYCEGHHCYRPCAPRDRALFAGVRAGDLVFASGQIPIDPATGEFVAGGIAEQTEQVLRNLTAVFEAAGVGMNQVVKTTVFLADMDDFTAMNEVYGRFFATSRRREPQFKRPDCRVMPGLRLKRLRW